LLAKAEATLLAAQDLSNHATDLQDSLLGRVRIGLNCSTDRLQVPRLVERMLAACPGVEAQFDREASQEIIDRLLAEEVDAGFVCGEVPDGFSVRPLPSLDLDVVAPADWHGKLRNAGWAELAALPWIGGGESCPFQMEVDRIFRPKGLQPRYAARSDDENVRMSLVEAGVGLAVFDSLDAARAFGQGRVATWDREKLHCPLSFVHLASRRNDPLVKAVRQSVLEIWPGEARPSCEVIPLRG
jgi:DNA-binding transcriptional LysR family regulator